MQVGCAGDPKLSPAWSVLCSLSTSPRIMGPVGSASAMKLALNQLIVIETVSAARGLVDWSIGPCALLAAAWPALYSLSNYRSLG